MRLEDAKGVETIREASPVAGQSMAELLVILTAAGYVDPPVVSGGFLLSYHYQEYKDIRND